ncbi:MAG: DNA replication initiation complex subunit [Thermoproteus sp.]
MLNKIYAWLSAELSSKLLARPPASSYTEIANEINEELKESALPPALEEGVRIQLARALASIIEIRLKKIAADLYQGREPRDLVAEEERLISSLRKILEMPPKTSGRYEIVLFLNSFQTISTSEFKYIGPFNRGDLAKIPAEDAKELEAKGLVKRFRLI